MSENSGTFPIDGGVIVNVIAFIIGSFLPIKDLQISSRSDI